MYKVQHCILAAILLYCVSLLGILTLYSTASVTGVYSPLALLDVVVYLAFVLIAFFIQKGQVWARWFYAVCAIVWYVALFTYLPSKYGHHLDFFSVILQIVLAVVAFGVMLMTPMVKGAAES